MRHPYAQFDDSRCDPNLGSTGPLRDLTVEGDHLDHHPGAVFADVVTTNAFATSVGLLEVFDGERGKGDRDPRVELDPGDAGSTFTRDRLVVGRLTTDDTADADHRIDDTRLGEHLSSQGKFEGPGNPIEAHVIVGNSGLAEAAANPVQEPDRDLGIPAGGDDPDTHIAS